MHFRILNWPQLESVVCYKKFYMEKFSAIFLGVLILGQAAGLNIIEGASLPFGILKTTTLENALPFKNLLNIFQGNKLQFGASNENKGSFSASESGDGQSKSSSLAFGGLSSGNAGSLINKLFNRNNVAFSQSKAASSGNGRSFSTSGSFSASKNPEDYRAYIDVRYGDHNGEHLSSPSRWHAFGKRFGGSDTEWASGKFNFDNVGVFPIRQVSNTKSESSAGSFASSSSGAAANNGFLNNQNAAFSSSQAGSASGFVVPIQVGEIKPESSAGSFASSSSGAANKENAAFSSSQAGFGATGLFPIGQIAESKSESTAGSFASSSSGAATNNGLLNNENAAFSSSQAGFGARRVIPIGQIAESKSESTAGSFASSSSGAAANNGLLNNQNAAFSSSQAGSASNFVVPIQVAEIKPESSAGSFANSNSAAAANNGFLNNQNAAFSSSQAGSVSGFGVPIQQVAEGKPESLAGSFASSNSAAATNNGFLNNQNTNSQAGSVSGFGVPIQQVAEGKPESSAGSFSSSSSGDAANNGLLNNQNAAFSSSQAGSVSGFGVPIQQVAEGKPESLAGSFASSNSAAATNNGFLNNQNAAFTNSQAGSVSGFGVPIQQVAEGKLESSAGSFASSSSGAAANNGFLNNQNAAFSSSQAGSVSGFGVPIQQVAEGKLESSAESFATSSSGVAANNGFLNNQNAAFSSSQAGSASTFGVPMQQVAESTPKSSVGSFASSNSGAAPNNGFLNNQNAAFSSSQPGAGRIFPVGQVAESKSESTAESFVSSSSGAAANDGFLNNAAFGSGQASSSSIGLNKQDSGSFSTSGFGSGTGVFQTANSQSESGSVAGGDAGFNNGQEDKPTTAVFTSGSFSGSNSVSASGIGNSFVGSSSGAGFGSSQAGSSMFQNKNGASFASGNSGTSLFNVPESKSESVAFLNGNGGSFAGSQSDISKNTASAAASGSSTFTNQGLTGSTSESLANNIFLNGGGSGTKSQSESSPAHGIVQDHNAGSFSISGPGSTSGAPLLNTNEFYQHPQIIFSESIPGHLPFADFHKHTEYNRGSSGTFSESHSGSINNEENAAQGQSGSLGSFNEFLNKGNIVFSKSRSASSGSAFGASKAESFSGSF